MCVCHINTYKTKSTKRHLLSCRRWTMAPSFDEVRVVVLLRGTMFDEALTQLHHPENFCFKISYRKKRTANAMKGLA